MRRIRKGDTVVVIAGKEKGKRGKVLHVLTKQDRVIVERVMMVKRHTKPSQRNQQGGIIDISNVMPVDPGSDKPTRVHVKHEEAGRRRVGKSGTVIEAAK